MHQKIYFVKNENIRSLLNLYETPQGPLYHYTKEAIANEITDKNEFRFSRADTFTDKKEISYGLEILKKTAEEILSDEEKKEFLNILKEARERLKKCYVFCLSQEGDNKYLLEKFSDGKTRIKFKEEFPINITNRTWHSVKTGDGYSIHPINDIYRNHEGFIIYNELEQKENAKKICTVFQGSIKEGIHIVDKFHFINAIVKFIILCKREKYSKEAEYRIALITKDEIDNEFEKQENERIFINLILPPGLKSEIIK
jgi:hypothetical protein